MPDKRADDRDQQALAEKIAADLPFGVTEHAERRHLAAPLGQRRSATCSADW